MYLRFFLCSFSAFQNVPSPNVTAIKLMNDFMNKGYAQNYIDLDFDTLTSGRRYVHRGSCGHSEEVVIVMDASGSIGSCEFEKGKKALKYMLKLINSKDLDSGKYAAVTFSTSTTVNFNFLSPSSASEKIMQLSYPSGSTNTQAALDAAKRLFFDTSAGTK